MGKLVTIATKARFDALREASNISETSLNFILETGLLYTHNIFINGASFGTATSNYIPVKIGGVTKNLSLNGHTHSNYYDNSSDIDIGSNKIKSGTLELLKYSSDTLILGNSSIPTEFFGTLKTIKDGTKYTILDTNNFSIVNKTSTNLTLNNVALFKYGGSSFQLDYVRRYNTVETFNNLAKYTSAGTTNENSKAYGFITLSTDTGTNTYSYAQIRVSIPDNTLEFRTSSDTTWKGTLLGGVYRNITINGTTYSIVTKAGSLPTIIAPTALGTSGQYLATSDDGKSLTWRTLPTDNNTWRPIAVNGTEKRSSSTGSGNLDIINGTNTTVEWTSSNKLKINAVDTWNAMTGATSSANGTVGYVNATPPKDGYNTKFLRADGTWSVPAYPTKDSWNYDGRYLRYYRYSSSETPNANSLSDGWHDAHVAIANAPTTNHGTLILNSYNGTPFLIFIPDASYYVYKRYNTGSIGGTWTKISAGYADSAGKAANDSDGNAINTSYLRYRGATTTNQEATLWSQIGIKQYNGVLPDGLSGGIYTWGQAISFAGNDARFDIYVSHNSSNPSHNGNGVYYRSGWLNDKKEWVRFLDGNNSSVSLSGSTLSVKINGTTQSLTNTWRGILNNLTSDSTTDSLSAALGKALANGSARDSTKLSLSGGTLTGSLEISTGSINNEYNEGLRVTRANNGWAGITLGSTGRKGAPTDGWFVATNPSKLLIVSPDTSANTTGLTLNKNGDALWRNNVIYHAGNLPAYPIVNNASLTIQSNGSTITTFTANLSSDTTFNLVPGTGISFANDTNNRKITISTTTGTLAQGQVVDTHGEGNATVVLGLNSKMGGFYERGGTCNAYEVSINTTDFTGTLNKLSTLSSLGASVFDGFMGYYGSYTGDNFAVYDLRLPLALYYGSSTFWSFGNGSWAPKKIRVLSSVDGTNWILCYSSDTCPAYGKTRLLYPSGQNHVLYIRFVFNKYSRISFLGGIDYEGNGGLTLYMTKYLNDPIYRHVTPGKNNTYMLGYSSAKWASVYATTFYGDLSGNATSATKLLTSRTLWGQSFDGSANVSGSLSSVANISFDQSGRNIGGIAYFDTTNNRIGVRTSSPTGTLHVHLDNQNGSSTKLLPALRIDGKVDLYDNVTNGGTKNSMLNLLSNGTHEYGTVVKIHSYGNDAPTIRFSHSNSIDDINNQVNTAWSVGMSYNSAYGFCVVKNRGISGWGTEVVTINSSENVGIGTTSPSYKLHATGDIYSTGYIRANSGFVKTNSSDSYVLLGGGGHYALSNLIADYLGNFGGAWHHLQMSNTSTDKANKWYIIAKFDNLSPGSYMAAKVIGYFYKHNANWECGLTLELPFQVMVNFTDGTASFWTHTAISDNNLRLIQINSRGYELLVKEGNHTDFDVFYQVVNASHGVTYYEGSNFVQGSDGTVITRNLLSTYGNYAYRADIWATDRTLTIGNKGKTVNGSANVSWTLTEIGIPSWALASTKPSYSWNEITGKPSTFTPSSHTHDYMPWNNVSSLNANDASPGWYNSRASITNAAHTNHSSLLYVNNVGTPYQLQIPDSSVLYIYKRWYTSGAWSAWSKISAGYADSAGSVAWANVSSKPAATGGATTPVYWNGSGFTNCTAYASASVNYANYAGYSNKVLGSYTSNGGQQNPNYFGVNRVGFLMMNTTVNGNSHYKDWVIMDCYGGNDAGGGVAIGINRQSLGAYIMRSAAARTSWAESAELIGTHNYTTYCATSGHNHDSVYAKLGAHNNLTASGNEFTFASSGFSGGIYFNYRTAGGTNGNITEYIFGNGKGGALGTAIHSGNWSSYITLSSLGAAAASHSHNYLPKLDWWAHDHSHSVDSLTSGTTFAYTSHGAPTNGTIVAFSCNINNYQLQLQGSYSGEYLYFRNKNDDNGTWLTWRSIIHSGNIGSQSVSNSDMCDGLHVHSGRNNEANKIVRTDGSGYIQCDWINTTSGGFYPSDAAMTRVYCSNDAYLRYLSPSDFISKMGILSLSGGTMTGALTVKLYIFGYNYNHAGSNAPSFVFDKPGSHFTGIGANGEADTIYFSAATISNGEASWVTSYEQKWKFNGNVAATNFYTTSDRNKKQNISSFSEHIRKFQLKDTEKWHYGVIAQEVEEMFRNGEEGNMTVNYNSVLSYYVGLLENKVASLEKELNSLKQKLK